MTARIQSAMVAIAAALCVEARAQVVINEIHYHPSNETVGPGEDAEGLQFIELYNQGPGAVDLSGWSFSEGVVYAFQAGTTLAAGQFGVLAKDPAFLKAHGPAIPDGVPVWKWTSGDLANSGEVIEIRDAASQVVDRVAYDDVGLWPTAADGLGPSLELINPAYDNAFPLVWRASAGTNGTPGRPNSRFTEGPAILAIDPPPNSLVQGFDRVSITFAEPVQGVGASALVVDGSAAKTVTCGTCTAGAGAGPYVFEGFGSPKSNPFTVTLAAGTIRDLDSHAFAGQSWTEYFSFPRVVINEIHYNPASSTDDEEFVELYNADTNALDLSGYRLGEFASPGCVFPAGTSLPPGGYLVCAKNPAALFQATGVLATHSWGQNDSLGNGGEGVSLINADGAVVDRVEYDDDPPWPSGPDGPDGHGPSLELVHPALDNAQGQFWRASLKPNGTPAARNSTYEDAPVVASETPARGSVIVSLAEVSVAFSKPVVGVTAEDLRVNGVPALAVSGSGAGPYVFSVQDPGFGVVQVVLSGQAIHDLQGTPFAGDAWLYFYSLPRVVINEIHYHPPASAVAPGESAQDLQFLELYNADPWPVDLSGYAITEGVDLVFPDGTTLEPGGFLVLAKNPAFLKAKVSIPASVQVLAWASGDLADGGEVVELSDRYGRVVDRVAYDDRGDWPDAPDGHGPSLELIHPLLPNEAAGAWKPSIPVHGTPGAVNSVFEQNPGPILFQPRHAPPLPRSNQPVTITVTALTPGGAPPAVTLYFRKDMDQPIGYSAMPMLDDGLHGDGEAGDARFGAVVPGLPDGQQLDFYIEASDGAKTAVAPAGHAVPDASGQPSQTFLCKFSDEVLPNDFPVYHLLVTLRNKHRQEALQGEIPRKTPFDATFMDEKGNIWYNVTERYRGQSSILKLPSSYRVDFPSNRKLETPLGFAVRTLQLNSMRPMAQYLGFDLFNRAGMPAPKVAWARLRYTGINYDTCCKGQNGFYGLYVVVERVDEDFLDSQGGAVPDRGMSPDGNVYRGRNDANFRWEGTDPGAYKPDANNKNGYEKYNNEGADFWGDLIALCDALNNSAPEWYVEHVRAHVDVDRWARFFALHMVLGNREGGIYRDTGDDYFLYFPPPADPNNPKHPDYGTPQMPDDRLSGRSVLIPWDTDAVLWDQNETIWRTHTDAPMRFLRHNAFAPIFVQAIEDLATNEFSPQRMGEVIDAMPDQAFGVQEGSDLWPETKQQYKNWIANRVAFVLNETWDALTLDGAPEIRYEDPNPVIHLTGRLPQAGTHNLTVNGMRATYSVFEATWSADLALAPGVNPVLVQAWDRSGNEKARVEATVFYNPPGPWNLHLEMRAPTRMVNDKTLTIEARIVDPIGRVSYRQWDEVGKVTVTRLPFGTPVAITPTVFDPHIPVPDDSIHFFNGWGSVSFTLDQGADFAPGDIEVTVEWHGLRASRVVTVLKDPAFRDVSGTLTGANLVWGPDENIRVTGNCTVPAGSTLTILPGTLVQVNTTGSLENGTLISVLGGVQALGTKDKPIFFFSERGPAAMTLTQSGSASNGDAWRGFQFRGSGSSTLRHLILTGAGNGNVVSHPRPPILGFFDTHSVFVDRCVFADNNGMVFSGQGTGEYTIRKTLVSRAGIGGEFFRDGHRLRIRDSWFTGIGHAPEANNLDGDILHVDGAHSDQLIRGCIIHDGGDDGIDHSASSFRVEHSIIYKIRDKAISMTGGHVDAENVLVFETGTGIRGTASVDHVTLTVPSPIQTVDRVYRSIVWPSSLSTCSGDVDYSDLGNPADLGCGNGNLSTDPQFLDPAHRDYNPRPGSPVWTAGPDQDRIGWLGFPYGATCRTTEDCDDENACTEDTCVDRLCVFTPIVGCIPCDIHEDCDDGNDCTADVCKPDGACTHAPVADGTPCDDRKACTAPDQCAAGVCLGPENCAGQGHCTPSGVCSAQAITVTFQEGLNGYAGTHDTFLNMGMPDTVFGAYGYWRWDLADPEPYEEFGLLKFEGLFGGGANQIPPGAAILSATLSLVAEDGSDAPGEVHEASASWDEASATWNNFGAAPGVQPEEVGEFVGHAPVAAGVFELDVTRSVSAWAMGERENQGWVFVPASPDGVSVWSSEAPAVANRPRLVVVYAPPAVSCAADAECDDGRFCTGVETCDPVQKVCRTGAPVNCDDGVGCTMDSCVEATHECSHLASDALCDDGNLCTDDRCDPALGCAHLANTAPCDDGDACTVDDHCGGGSCTGGGPLSCDDGVACTADSCDPAAGCQHEDACADGMVCDPASGECEKGPVVVSFQQDVDGYSGTVDTYLHAGMPDADNSRSATLIVDGPAPPEDEREILLRFDGVFGAGPGQVPPGAPIAWARLSLFVTNPSDDGAGVYRALRDWRDTDTWNSLDGGVSLDGVEAESSAEAFGATNSNKVFYDFDVTESLVAWSSGQSNRGWVIAMRATGSDSWQFASSEALDPAERPRLQVAFTPCEPGFAGDGVACHDVNECQASPGPCDPNATCVNSVGSFECTCKPGFQGDGFVCEDLDECEQGPCDPNANCVNIPGSYRCFCKAGYVGDGKSCEDVDECSADPAPCDPNADCTNLEGSFACECRDGYAGDGFTCGECPGGAMNPCNAHGICSGTAEHPVCECEAGFGGDACEDCVPGRWGPLCDRECPGGASNPCHRHGECSDGMDGTGECVSCFEGFAGDACDRCAEGYFGYPDCTACPSCNDGNPCTTDSCGFSQCIHEFNTLPCDDGNACTTADVCRDGICSGTPVDCDDHDPCTLDSCNAGTGECVHLRLADCTSEDASEAAPDQGAREEVGPGLPDRVEPPPETVVHGPSGGGGCAAADSPAAAGPLLAMLLALALLLHGLAPGRRS